MVNQSLRMIQTLKQSPQQVLLSTLLQLPMIALEQRIKVELQENPLLEEVLEEELDVDEQIEPELSLEEDVDREVQRVAGLAHRARPPVARFSHHR